MATPPPVPSAPAPSGYLSEKDRKQFTLTAGILGCVFFVLQFLAPMLVGFVMMPGFMMGSNFMDKMRSANVQNGVLQGNEFTFLSRPFAGGEEDTSVSLSRIDISREETEPVEIAEWAQPGSAWLLQWKGKATVVGSSMVARIVDGQLEPVSEVSSLGRIFPPFLWDDTLTVCQRVPEGFQLLTFNGKDWEKQSRLNLGSLDVDAGPQSLLILPVESGFHLFMELDRALFHSYRTELPEPDSATEWSPVAEVGGDWTACLHQGVPVVAWLESSSESVSYRVHFARLHDGKWRPFLNQSVPMAEEIGLFSRDEGLLLVASSFFGSLRVLEIEGGSVVAERRLHKQSLYPDHFFGLMMIPHLGTVILPFVLCFILTLLMARHRVQEHRAGSQAVVYGSLMRRAVAQLVDYLLLGLPMIVGMFQLIPFWTDFEMMMSEDFLKNMLAGGILLGVGILWGLTGFCLIVWTEGRWGWSPGKAVAGLRVVTSKHEFCGFGASLIRNILKFVDGFFNFMVGVMLVALTEKWQRVGDLAADTIVVRTSSLPSNR